MKKLRLIKSSFVMAGFLAFFFALLITRDIVNLPYIDFTDWLPDELPPLSNFFWKEQIKGFLLFHIAVFLSYFLPTLFVSLIFYFYFYEDKNETIQRGQGRVSAKALRKAIKRVVMKDYRLELFKEKIPLPYNEENRSFLFLGKAGAGKTQAIYDFLVGNKKKKGFKDFNQTMIIYERKGDDFISKLYRDEIDFLFDPRDIRGIKWNIFTDLFNEDGEIEEAMVDFYSKAFQPISDSKNNHFEKQAQAIIKAIFIKIAHKDKPNNKMLIDFLLNHSDLKSLKDALICDSNVKKFGLVGAVENALTTDSEGNANNQGMSVMATLNHTFRSIARREFYNEEGDFSIRYFFETIDVNPDRRIFIVNTPETAGAFGAYFSLMFMLIFKFGKTMKNDNNRRVLLMIDELQSLGSDGNFLLGRSIIEELINFLAESRSKGFVSVAATQSLPQLEKLIERQGMRSLFQLLSTKIILQYDEPDGAKFITEFFSENEILKHKETKSQAWSFTQDRTSFSEDEKLKKVVLPVELSTLKPLEAFVKIGNYPVSKVSVEYQAPKDICEALIRREIEYFEMDKPKEENVLGGDGMIEI